MYVVESLTHFQMSQPPSTTFLCRKKADFMVEWNLFNIFSTDFLEVPKLSVLTFIGFPSHHHHAHLLQVCCLVCLSKMLPKTVIFVLLQSLETFFQHIDGSIDTYVGSYMWKKFPDRFHFVEFLFAHLILWMLLHSSLVRWYILSFPLSLLIEPLIIIIIG